MRVWDQTLSHPNRLPPASRPDDDLLEGRGLLAVVWADSRQIATHFIRQYEEVRQYPVARGRSAGR